MRHRDIFDALHVGRILLPKYNDNFGSIRIFRTKLSYFILDTDYYLKVF